MDRETLYKLTPGEFEQLCIEILKAQGFKFVRFIGVPGSPDLGADIIAQTTEGYTIIQVTHTLRLSRIKIRQDIVHALQVAHEPKEILIITSAAVTAADREFVQIGRAHV